MSDSNPVHYIEGDRIYLRELRLSDVNEDYYRWMNDAEVTQYLESRFSDNSLESIRNYVAGKQGKQDCIFLAIVLKEGNRHIGNIKLEPINRIHSHAELGIIIGSKTVWGKGYATEAIRLAVDYAFHKLNLHRVTAGCYSNNEFSIKAFKKVGFEIEGVRKEHFLSNGRYVDHVLLGITRKT
jgi:RimJ/RimL family protein N-acetyltransferase